jgi:hypothetical protein
MDATTAVRFHTGEVLISSAFRLAVIPLLGITLWQLLVYESLMAPVIMFHHSNVKLPEKADRLMRALIASLAIHRGASFAHAIRDRQQLLHHFLLLGSDRRDFPAPQQRASG